jgi:TolA-binding protein
MDGANVAGRGGQPALIAILMGALSGLVYGAGGAMPVEAAPPDPSVRALQRQLEQRDAVIEDLQRRVQELERRTGGAVKSTTPNAEATTGADAATPEQAAQGPAAPTEEQKAAETPPTSAGSAPPGQVTVSDEEAERG